MFKRHKKKESELGREKKSREKKGKEKKDRAKKGREKKVDGLSNDSSVTGDQRSESVDATESNHKAFQTPTSNTLDSGTASNPTPDPEPESSYGLKELVAQPHDNAEAVDIIAIHGLNGTREGTWTDRDTKINWLCHKDFLPKIIPNARVLSFGYNSKSYFNSGNPGVNDFASELLASISTSRKTPEEKQRPIVFVCHSLGGLVFKKVCILLT